MNTDEIAKGDVVDQESELDLKDFMRPEYKAGLWLQLELVDAAFYIPADLFQGFPDEHELEPYPDSPIASDDSDDDAPAILYDIVRGVGARLATSDGRGSPWFVLGTEEHARRFVRWQWTVDPDTGEGLWDSELDTSGDRTEQETEGGYDSESD